MESVLVHLRKLRVDLLLLFSLLGLMVFGATFILSAAMDQYEIEPLLNTYFFRQLGFYAVGLTLGLFFIVVDYHRLAGWARTAYWITIILLILVLIPGIGVVRYGAQRWFDLGITLIQPSEFAKLAFIFALADFLTRPNEEMLMPGVFLKALGMTALPFLLILKEPDLGSSLVFFPIGTAMMFVAGVPLRFLGKFLGASTVVVLFVIINALYFPADWRISLQEYQRQRLLVYFDKDFAPPNATPVERKAARELQRERTHNIRQAEISVGSGGLTGKGWGQGPQTRLGYLPRGVAPSRQAAPWNGGQNRTNSQDPPSLAPTDDTDRYSQACWVSHSTIPPPLGDVPHPRLAYSEITGLAGETVLRRRHVPSWAP